MLRTALPMSDDDREEFAALVRGFSAYFEWARDSGASALSRVEGMALPPRGAARPPVSAPSAAPVAAPTAAPVAPRPSMNVAAPNVSVATPSAPTVAPIATPTVRATDAPAPTAAVEPTPTPAPASVSSVSPSAGPAITGEARVRALAVVEDTVRGCTACKLCSGRTQTVFSRGNPEAELFFVGEAPGADEDRIGRPFVGAAGQLLDRILAAMGLGEENVYIANVAKCRPPNNRPPEPDEVASCAPYLMQQIDLVRPKIIVSWGRTPTALLLQTSESMTKLRGRWHEFRGIPLLATWHPAYLLRNPDAKKDTWADMKRVMERLGRPLAPTK
jgi:uracil-DNA glycosylase family 4